MPMNQNQSLGGGSAGLQQLMQNPQAMNQLRQMIMQRMGQGGGMPAQSAAMPAQSAGMPGQGGPAMNPVAAQAMNQGANPQARIATMAGMPAQSAGMPAQSAGMPAQPAAMPQGGYSPNAAAQGNPQLAQQMQQNRFMQMLQQRLNQR